MIQKITKSIEKLAEREPFIVAVYLLGSILDDRLRADSDIDLAVMIDSGQKMRALKRADIAGSLSYELGRLVDLGEISSRNLVYAREALLKGKLIYQRDRDKVNLVRANLLGMYVQFNMDRQEVLDAYRAG